MTGRVDEWPAIALVIALMMFCVGLALLTLWVHGKGHRSPVTSSGPILLAVLVAVVGATPSWIAADGDLDADLALRTTGILALALVSGALLVRLLPRGPERVAGVRRSRFPHRTMAWVTGVGLLLGGGVLALRGYPSVGRGLMVGAGPIAAIFELFARRARAPQVPRAVDLVTGGPSVLLLRTFRDEGVPFSVSDARRARAGPRRWWGELFPDHANDLCSAERYLGPAIGAAVGPLVGLGNPVDTLPPDAGMVRYYAPDADWQEDVARLVGRARAVLILAGRSTRSLSWELTYLREVAAQDRTFVLLSRYPPPESTSGRYRPAAGYWRAVRLGKWKPVSWSEQVAELAALGWFLPPAYPGPASIIGFDRSGRGYVLVSGAQSAGTFAEAIARALRRTN